MELFSAQPDLSLQISPPNAASTTSEWRKVDENLELGFWRSPLEPLTSSFATASVATAACTVGGADAAAAAVTSINKAVHFHRRRHPLLPEEYCARDESFMKPLTGIPIYQHAGPFNLVHPRSQEQLHHLCGSSSSSPSYSLGSRFKSAFASSQGYLSRLRFPAKRTMRAPRMRWTTTLHARFVHAVELLGGHERATPKSVLELMDVKDLTLAHVKSHLQMYRTVKNTDKAAVLSGQSEEVENCSRGENSDETDEVGIQNVLHRSESSATNSGIHHVGLWSNSSNSSAVASDHGGVMKSAFGKNCNNGIPGDSSAGSMDSSKDMQMFSELNSETELNLNRPNLEITLGWSR